MSGNCKHTSLLQIKVVERLIEQVLRGWGGGGKLVADAAKTSKTIRDRLVGGLDNFEDQLTLLSSEMRFLCNNDYKSLSEIS